MLENASVSQVGDRMRFGLMLNDGQPLGHIVMFGLLACYIWLFNFAYDNLIIRYRLYFSFQKQVGDQLGWFAVLALAACFYLILVRIGKYRCLDSAYKVFSLLFMLIVCVPITVLSVSLNMDSQWRNIFYAVGVALLMALLTRIRVPVLRVPAIETRSAILLPLGMVLFFLMYLLFFYRGSLGFVGLFDVYAKRAEAESFSGPLLRYLTGTISGSAAPFLIAVGLWRKNTVLFLVGVLGFVLIYLMAGHKSSLIGIALVVAVFFAFRKPVSLLGMLLCLNALVAGVLLIDFWIFDAAVLSPFTIDRMLMAPAVLSIYYLDYFSWHEPLRLGYSILAFLAPGQVIAHPAEVIGAYYFKGDWANVNFIGEGFANFRQLGVLLYLVLTCLIVIFYDAIAAKMTLAVRLAAFLPAILFLLNASPLTLILSGGFLVLSIFIVLTPGDDK